MSAVVRSSSQDLVEFSDSNSGGSSSESLEDESDRCTCGTLDAARRAHQWSCPFNVRNIGKSSTSDDIFKAEIPTTESRQDELDIAISGSVEEHRTQETMTDNCSDSELVHSFIALLKTQKLSIAFVEVRKESQWLHVTILRAHWNGSILSVLACPKLRKVDGFVWTVLVIRTSNLLLNGNLPALLPASNVHVLGQIQKQ